MVPIQENGLVALASFLFCHGRPLHCCLGRLFVPYRRHDGLLLWLFQLLEALLGLIQPDEQFLVARLRCNRLQRNE